jgi:hypothetical protein
MRIVVAVIVAMALGMSAAGHSTAQDDEDNRRTMAEDVRELVFDQSERAVKQRQLMFKQRERVLAHIASTIAGEEEGTESQERQLSQEADFDVEDGEPEDGEPEDGEPEDGEPEDGEPEDGEPEDGEPEDGEPEDGEDEAVGGDGEACEPSGGEDASSDLDGEATSDEVAADEANEPERGGVGAGESEDNQPEGGEGDPTGEQVICALPSTGTGTASDSRTVQWMLAALAAAVVAGFGLRLRVI